MTVYNFNIGIGWASSGVEYAQAYRAQSLRKKHVPAKFVYTELILYENLVHMCENIGIKADEVLWLYTYFTDIKDTATTYTVDDFLATVDNQITDIKREDKTIVLTLGVPQKRITLYLKNSQEDFVERAEYVENDLLIRKDYFSHTRVFTEYYAPKDNAAHAYQRRFYNEDGSTAYEEICEKGTDSMFIFPDKIIYSKEELITYFMQQLHLTDKDIVILDRETGQGQQIFETHKPAKLGVVIHADHYSKNNTNDDYILWNNYYDYQFTNHQDVDFYIVATPTQTKVFQEQMKKYNHAEPKIYTIPVGNLDELKYPHPERKPYSMVTASRLATEKHIDWIIEATVNAHKQVPELNLDIYGKGSEFERLNQQINNLKATDYIHLMGQHDMTDVYRNYEAYLSGSTSEGFGLSLMEAIGSGLPIIGMDVPYGNPTFVDNGLNGYLTPKNDYITTKQVIADLTDSIIKYFTQTNLDSFHKYSYQKAQEYLVDSVADKWDNLVKQEVGEC